MDLISLAISKKFTEDTASEMGAVKGAPCQIKSITDITGGHRVTFKWVDKSDVEHTDTMDVMDGEQGEAGATPDIEVSSITGGHRVTITTGSAVDTFDVMDGTDGKDGADGKNGRDGIGVLAVELTQAEYNALSEEEKMNGTEYFVTDGV